jgi:hypothetical protein
MRPISVLPYLTSEPATVAPEGFTLVDAPITRGLPHRFMLDQRIRLTLLVPHGLAHEWRDADPQAVVSASDDERARSTAAQIARHSEIARPPVRLMVEVDTVLQESVAVVVGSGLSTPGIGSETRGVKLELVILSWLITAGSMRSAGDYGSRIRLAWRARGRGVDSFGIPPVNPNIVPRLEQAQVFIPLIVQPIRYDTIVYSALAFDFEV